MLKTLARGLGSGLRNAFVAIGALIFTGGVIVVADVLITPGATSTVFAFVCFTSKICPAHTIVNSAGTEISKAGNTAVVADPAVVVSDPNVLAAINSAIPTGTNNIGAVEVLDSGGTNKLTIKAASTPSVATDTGAVVDVRPSCGACITLGPATAANSVPVIASPPTTQVTNSATGTTAATVATLAAVSSKTNYVCGFTITADATALATGTATLAGTISGSMAYLQTVQAVASGTSDLTKNFNPCIPASAVNTAITITSVAAGTGGNTIANIWGFVQ